jgi:hypothetical protein
MAQPHHFIRIKTCKLLYGRVPKAANSSIKAALCRLLSERPPKGTKTTSDKFWQHETNNETELITLRKARKYRSSHFSFSFVRNPFDRLIAAYNNKVIEIEHPPLPMQNMGIHHDMSFESFLDVLIDTPYSVMTFTSYRKVTCYAWDDKLFQNLLDESNKLMNIGTFYEIFCY